MMATMRMDTTTSSTTSTNDQVALDAKSALRNALRAKLKSGSTFEETTSKTTTSTFGNSSISNTTFNMNQNVNNNSIYSSASSIIDIDDMDDDSTSFVSNSLSANVTKPTTINLSSTTSAQLVDVESFGMESDDSDDSDKSDDKETSNSASTIPLEERRLRNRLAARKCREKRKQRILNLEKICNNLEGRISMLTTEIEGLDGQKKNLTQLLENHACVRLTPKPTAVIKNAVMSK